MYLGVKLVSAEPCFGRDNKCVPENSEFNGTEKEGYKVTYEDGYTSWSPKEVFKKAYRPITGLTFGLAIEALKQGKKVARTGWNGKGMWLKIVNMQMMNASPDYPEVNWTDFFINLPTIAMKTADDKIVFGWLASQTDILAEDWMIVH